MTPTNPTPGELSGADAKGLAAELRRLNTELAAANSRADIEDARGRLLAFVLRWLPAIAGHLVDVAEAKAQAKQYFEWWHKRGEETR